MGPGEGRECPGDRAGVMDHFLLDTGKKLRYLPLFLCIILVDDVEIAVYVCVCMFICTYVTYAYSYIHIYIHIHLSVCTV